MGLKMDHLVNTPIMAPIRSITEKYSIEILDVVISLSQAVPRILLCEKIWKCSMRNDRNNFRIAFLLFSGTFVKWQNRTLLR